MATARAKRSLPSTPKRRNAVCKRLYHMMYSQEAEAEDFPEQGNRKQQRGLSEETKAAVIAFYERDDVSRQALWRKNFTTIREGSGQKRQLQTRHLTTSVREAYAFFVEANPDVSVGKSTFASLQPQNVLLSSKLPHNVCLCKYHENFIAAVNAIHRAVPEFPDYSRTLPATFLCDPSTKMCWMNECNECKDGKGFQTKCRDMLSEVAADFCSWFIWKNDEDGKLAKVCEEGSIDELVEYFSGILPQFLQHTYYKREQAASYQLQRETAALDSASHRLLQVDFSENYTCEAQDEIQSDHWKQSQVSLFTAAFWYSETLHSIVMHPMTLRIRRIQWLHTCTTS